MELEADEEGKNGPLKRELVVRLIIQHHKKKVCYKTSIKASENGSEKRQQTWQTKEGPDFGDMEHAKFVQEWSFEGTDQGHKMILAHKINVLAVQEIR